MIGEKQLTIVYFQIWNHLDCIWTGSAQLCKNSSSLLLTPFDYKVYVYKGGGPVISEMDQY